VAFLKISGTVGFFGFASAAIPRMTEMATNQMRLRFMSYLFLLIPEHERGVLRIDE
jgi:hypothetical protein